MSSFDIAEFDSLTLADFQTWSDDALRCYLSLRNKNVVGTSVELAARAFVCCEENLTVNETQEHKLRRNLVEYFTTPDRTRVNYNNGTCSYFGF